MQDSIISAVFLTMKNTFLNKKDYTELLFQSTINLLEKENKNTRLFLLLPAIIKPKRLWTGKQLFSNIIKVVIAFSGLKFKDQKGLKMKSTTKIGEKYLKGYEEET